MKPKLTICPICGSDRLKLLRSDFRLKVGTQSITVPRLERYQCPECGEVLFDYDGARRIEEARSQIRPLTRSA